MTARPEPTLGADERELAAALKMAIRQNAHDMVMTGEEIRQCEAALASLLQKRERQTVPNGYAEAFYELTALMGVPAQPKSPETVWREQMLPRLRAALAAPAVVVSAEPVATSLTLPVGWTIDRFGPDEFVLKKPELGGGIFRKNDESARISVVAEFLSEMLATPVGPDAVDGWQPIETTPKDGSEFLAAWGRQGNIVQIVKWNAIHKFWQTKGEPLMGFTNNATAWMPLPKSPTAALASTKPSKGAA